MLRIRLTRMLFAGLMAVMFVAPVAASRGGKVTQPVDPGLAVPLSDCPNPVAGNSC
ncbi:MAG: hypothetical protein M5U34_47705 [Chloroflexi bacterium]|nr:hypothetical protein [Chloroflexota bacterium]